MDASGTDNPLFPPLEWPPYVAEDFFKVLQPEPLLQTVPWPRATWFDRVSPRGRRGAKLRAIAYGPSSDTMNVITPHGVLQICLLWSPPFRDMAAPMIRDVRESNPLPSQACQNRAALIDALSHALLVYDLMHRALPSTWPILQEEFKTPGLIYLKFIENVFSFLRRKGIPLNNPALRKHRRRTVQNALTLVETLMQDLTAEDFANAGHPTTPASVTRLSSYARRLNADLTTDVVEAFGSYGPQKFPRIAVYHSFAAILIALKVEAGTIPQVAGRLHKRFHKEAT
jgi:hypothetical protein